MEKEEESQSRVHLPNENRQLKFVLKIDKLLNVKEFRNESGSSIIKEITLQQFQSKSKSFVRSNLNKSNSLIACADEEKIQIWNLESKTSLPTLDSHSCWLYCLEKIDENRFASATRDRTIKIWATKKFVCLKELAGHHDDVSSLKSMSLNRIASGSYKEIKIWDIESGECIQTLISHSSWINCLTFLPNGNIMSCSGDTTIKVWNLERGECVNTFTGHSSSVQSLLLLNNGQVASGSHDKTIKIWNMASGECVKTLQGHFSFVFRLQVTDSGELISCSADSTIRVWDLNKEGRCIKTLDGHSSPVTSIRVNSQNSLLISCSINGTIKKWDFNTCHCVDTIYTSNVCSNYMRDLILI